MYKQKHILVIDDDKKLGNLLKSFLTEKGYLVDFVENTLIAKEKLFNIIFDLLILDVMLPKESGLSFASKLKTSNDTPILMLSAMSAPQDRIKGLKTGVDEYLAKPSLTDFYKELDPTNGFNPGIGQTSKNKYWK